MRELSKVQILKNGKRFDEVILPSLLKKIKKAHFRTFKFITENMDLLERYTEAPDSCFYHGNVGTGKTVNAIWRMLEASRLRYTNGSVRFNCEFTTVQKMLDGIKDGFSKPNQNIITHLENVDILVLDDLSSVQVTDWGYSILLRVIDTRWSMCRTTIFTDNKDLNDLAMLWGDDRIPDRIQGICGNSIYFFNTNSYRG